MRTIRQLITCGLGVSLAGCGRAATPAPTAEPAAAIASAPSDFSVYELGSSWTDQSGQTRPLASLGGKLQVVAMVYTTCTHTCPAILAEMKRLETGLQGRAGERVGFVFVSLDPAQDTPAQLAAYASSARLDAERWTLLTGDDAGVRELAVLLGIRYRDEAAGQISHSNAYLVLDAEGRIIHRQDGLRTGTANVLALLQSLAGA